MNQPNTSVPLYVVKEESGTGGIRALHSNMILSISFIPPSSELENTLTSRSVPHSSKRRDEGRQKSQSVFSDTSDSEEDVIFPSENYPPYRQHPENMLDKAILQTPMSNLLDSQGSASSTSLFSNRNLDSYYPDFSHSESTMIPYFHSGLESHLPEINVSDQPSVNYSVEGSGKSANMSNNLSGLVEEPRRTGRQRKPPDRYGEWISNPLVAWNVSDQTEYFV